MTAASQADAATLLFQAVRESIRVAVVVEVQSFDPVSRTATVLPLVQEERRVNGERRSAVDEPVEGVPVLMFGGLTRGLSLGLEVGDLALGLYRHRSHDELDDGVTTPVSPASVRRMDAADLVVLGGFSVPADGAPADSFDPAGLPVLFMKLTDALLVGNASAAKALALAEKVDARLSTIQSAFDTHVHTAAGAPSSPPQGSVVPGSLPPYPLPAVLGPLASVACDDVKVRS